ncbi:MAG: wax ester synthase/diacylglycerol acyltransferase [Actinomycetia bacterium]|nr:wax ester synthase/diacylglycerol acyltransferase [Actinomycetes bacterium]
MKQLSGLDAAFLYMETPSTVGHVSSLSIYERPSASYEPFAEWHRQVARRVHLLEPLTRRPVSVPFGLDHPFWVEDPHFHLDFHLRHTALPKPGTDEQLADVVARIIARPIDRAHPLWESHVIEGLPGDRFAILTKVHHATIDGASGAELLALMLDASPDGDAIDAPPPRDPAPRLPNDIELLAHAVASIARKPGRLLVLSARTLRELGRATRNPLLLAAGNQLRASLHGPLGAVLNLGRQRPAERDEPPLALPSLRAPRTPFNASITPQRSFAFRSTSLDTVKAVKNALGATVNDVVMAMCAGGLRTYLAAHDALPDDPLVAMVPVSIRTGAETEKWTNRVSGIIANLPTNEADPLLRVQKVHDSMMTAKGIFDALPADALTDFAQFSPPAVFTRASRMATRFQVANRFTAPVNLVVSNVPGPRETLYSAGARLLHYYPVSAIGESQGLNITVQSYRNTLDFGLVSCPALVPDLWTLADAIVDDLDALARASGLDVSALQPA